MIIINLETKIDISISSSVQNEPGKKKIAYYRQKKKNIEDLRKGLMHTNQRSNIYTKRLKRREKTTLT